MLDKSVFPVPQGDIPFRDDGFAENVFEQPGSELPTSYEEYLGVQEGIVQLRAHAGLDVLKLPIHRKLARLILSDNNMPTQQELINREAEVATCLFPQDSHDNFHHYFWFENGSWYLADYVDNYTWIAEYKITETSVEKFYKGVPCDLSASEEQTLLHFIERYHKTIQTQVYHAA